LKKETVLLKSQKIPVQKRLDILFPTLVRTRATKGRERKTDEDKPYYAIDPYRLDKKKINDSEVMARLIGKTQVCAAIQPSFPLAPLSPHIRNRMRHTNEVVSTSAMISCILNLNNELTEGVATGHDIGTCPFGHNGQKALGIKHGLNGAVIAQRVERGGEGLNLTWEVVEGIIEHSRDSSNLASVRLPNETKVVILGDEITYTAADAEDLKNLIKNYKNGSNGGKNKEITGITELLNNGLDKSLPEELNELGKNKRQIILSCINALVEESMRKNCVSFSESAVAQKLREVRARMYKEVYNELDKTEERVKQREDLRVIVEYVSANGLSGSLDPRFAVSFMTDEEARFFARMISDHNPNQEERQQIETLSFREIVCSLPKDIEINHLKSPLWKI